MISQPENVCFVARQNPRVGYVLKVWTMKYARHLMSQWHNRVVEGVQLSCQLELDLERVDRRDQSLPRRTRRDDVSEPARSPIRHVRSVHSEQDTIQKVDVEKMGSKGFDEREVGAKQRIMHQATKSFSTTVSKSNLERAGSSENFANSADSSCKLTEPMMDLQCLWIF